MESRRRCRGRINCRRTNMSDDLTEPIVGRKASSKTAYTREGESAVRASGHRHLILVRSSIMSSAYHAKTLIRHVYGSQYGEQAPFSVTCKSLCGDATSVEGERPRPDHVSHHRLARSRSRSLALQSSRLSLKRLPLPNVWGSQVCIARRGKGTRFVPQVTGRVGSRAALKKVRSEEGC